MFRSESAQQIGASLDSNSRLPVIVTLQKYYLPSQLLVLLLALLLRLWNVDFHSVWFDEAISLKWATSDPGYTWRTTMQLLQDKHPPLYYVSLHFWRELLRPFGLSNVDAALRLFGILLGVLTIWGLMNVVRRLDNSLVALCAGFLAALSPILIWYSVELRMFLPATGALIWASYFMVRALDTETPIRRAGYWALLSAMLLAALYTYLFSAFMLPAAGLMLLFHSGAARWRKFWEGSLTLFLTALLYLPLARNAWQVNSAESTPGRAFEQVGANLVHLLRNATIWRVNWPPSWIALAIVLLAIVVMAGLLLPLRQTPSVDGSFLAHGSASDGRRWLWVWLGSTLLVANLMLTRSASIFTQDRYLLFLIPLILWAIARGIVILGHRLPLVGVLSALAIVSLLGLALPQNWSPVLAREDWRSAAHYIVDYQAVSPHLPASVVVHVDYLHPALEWYVRQTAEFDELPIFFPYGSVLTEEMITDVIAPPLQGIVEFGSHTLWLVQSHLEGVDDDRLVEGWLATRFPVITELYPAGIKLSGYAMRSAYAELPQNAHELLSTPAALAPGLNLVGCQITTPQVSAQDRRLHPPSGWVHVRLWWRVESTPSSDYQITAQVVGPEGIWGELLQREGDLMHIQPTSTWIRGNYMRHELDINLNPVTPDGSYSVLIGVLTGSGEASGSQIRCADIEVVS